MRMRMIGGSFSVLGCMTLLFSSFSPLGPTTAISANIPKLQISPTKAELDGDGCISLNIKGSKFVGGGNVVTIYFQEIALGFVGAADIAPDGTFTFTNLIVCGDGPLSLGKHTVTALSSDGAGAVKTVNVVDNQ